VFWWVFLNVILTRYGMLIFTSNACNLLHFCVEKAVNLKQASGCISHLLLRHQHFSVWPYHSFLPANGRHTRSLFWTGPGITFQPLKDWLYSCPTPWNLC